MSATIDRFLTIPNCLTFLRIILVPFFIMAMNSKDYSLALKILIFAGFTDFLDGIIARKFNQISKIGIFLDPLADKMLLISIMITFYINELAPRWFLLLVMTRDIFVALGWLERYFTQKKISKPTVLGKISNASQVIIFSYILLSINFYVPQMPYLGYYFVSFLVIISFIQYVYIRLSNE